jgi:hypothetical protein
MKKVLQIINYKYCYEKVINMKFCQNKKEVELLSDRRRPSNISLVMDLCIVHKVV